METAREALAAVQKAIHAPKKETNTFGGYNYRNAEGVIAAFKAVAPDGAALTMTDRIEAIGDRIFLIATATFHWNGETITSESGAMHAGQKKGMDDAQITGACSSYARKYALCGLLLIDDSTQDPDTKDNRNAGNDPKPKKEGPSPAQVRDNMLDAIRGVRNHAQMQRIQNDTNYIRDLKWLGEVDPPKAAEVAHAAVQQEQKINAEARDA